MNLWQQAVEWMADHVAWTPVTPPPPPAAGAADESISFTDAEALRQAARRLMHAEAELEGLRREQQRGGR